MSRLEEHNHSVLQWASWSRDGVVNLQRDYHPSSDGPASAWNHKAPWRGLATPPTHLFPPPSGNNYVLLSMHNPHVKFILHCRWSISSVHYTDYPSIFNVPNWYERAGTPNVMFVVPCVLLGPEEAGASYAGCVYPSFRTTGPVRPCQTMSRSLLAHWRRTVLS